MKKIDNAIAALVKARGLASEFVNADAYVNPLIVNLQLLKSNLEEESIWDGLSDEEIAEIKAADKAYQTELLQAEAAEILRGIRVVNKEKGEKEEEKQDDDDSQDDDDDSQDDDDDSQDDDSDKTDGEPDGEADKTDGEPDGEVEKTDGEPAVDAVEPIVNVVEPVVIATDLGNIPAIEPVVPIVPTVKVITAKSRKTPALKKVKGAAMEPSI